MENPPLACYMQDLSQEVEDRDGCLDFLYYRGIYDGGLVGLACLPD
jgi:hypothetical protein